MSTNGTVTNITFIKITSWVPLWHEKPDSDGRLLGFWFTHSPDSLPLIKAILPPDMG